MTTRGVGSLLGLLFTATLIGSSRHPVPGSLVSFLSPVAIATVVTYLGAATVVGTPAGGGALPVNPVEEFLRGLMIGLTAGANFGIWSLVFSGAFFLGVLVALVGFLSVIARVAVTIPYKAVLGWSGWLMPMSYLATGPGALLFLLSLVFSPLGFGIGLRFDVITASIEITGGIVAAVGIRLTRFRGFNLGNFSFLSGIMPGGVPTPFTGPGISAHESGHSLTVGAFGGIFHWIDAVDENIPPLRRRACAYGELIAQGHFPSGAAPFLPHWCSLSDR